jgi:hypothetical protein
VLRHGYSNPVPDSYTERVAMSAKRQSIANYSTSIEAGKTVNEITLLLASAKATAILMEYDGFGGIDALSFRIQTQFGILSFRLPSNIEGVYAVMSKSPRVPRSLRNIAQARRVAWRIIYHWIDAQLAMIAAGVVKFEEVFLPYAQDDKGVTLYQRMQEQKFGNLLLENK